MSFGDILRNLLSDRGMTQKELAAQLNIAPSTLGNYIQDSREPDFETLKRIADYFDVSIDYLLDHRSKRANTFQEDELLTIFRAMTQEQRDVYVEQGKVVIRSNGKKDAAF